MDMFRAIVEGLARSVVGQLRHAQLSGKCEVILSALSTNYINHFILGVES